VSGEGETLSIDEPFPVHIHVSALRDQ